MMYFHLSCFEITFQCVKLKPFREWINLGTNPILQYVEVVDCECLLLFIKTDKVYFFFLPFTIDHFGRLWNWVCRWRIYRAAKFLANLAQDKFGLVAHKAKFSIRQIWSSCPPFLCPFVTIERLICTSICIENLVLLFVNIYSSRRIFIFKRRKLHPHFFTSSQLSLHKWFFFFF